ncbi:flagellar hook-associated protein FlgL [bacterium]|nr:flagellar hook-associated protein FlgL [bacterium]
MRVSERMKSYNLLSDINRSMSRMIKTQQDLSTAKRIHKPSDDPGGTTRLMQLKSQVRRTERYEKNIDDANQLILTTENAIQNVVDLITRADNMMLQAANDTLGAEERAMQALQMKEFWNQAIDIGNTSFAGKYIFGGTNNLTEPYSKISESDDETFVSSHDTSVYLNNVGFSSGTVNVTSADGSVTYTEGDATSGGDYSIDYKNGAITVHSSGSMADATDFLIDYDTDSPVAVELNPEGVSGEINRVIDEGMQMKINVSATQVFGDTNELQAALHDAYNALIRNERDSFQGARDALSSNLDRATGVQGEVGTKINRLDDQKFKLSADILNYKRLMSSIEDTDIAGALLQLERDQAVYQASLQTSARLIKNTLLDYL